MTFEPTPTLPDVVRIVSVRFTDQRGLFMEAYHEARFREAGITETFVQDNLSESVRGVLRGLHFQNPTAQGKLVRAIVGRIFDVAVDIRLGSPTFGRWVGVELSAENGEALWIPGGFAHGFCVLGERAVVSYKCTALYSPRAEHGLRWDDPDVGIDWPVSEPLLSPKDARALTLRELESAGALPRYRP